MFDLRKSTAGQVVQFKMVDSSTGLKKTGLSIANTDIKLIFEAGTTQTSKNSGGATEIGSTGVYYMTLDATDTATLGRLRADIEVSGALPWFGNFMVLSAVSWDALYASSGGAIPANTTQLAGQTVNASGTVTFPTSTLSSLTQTQVTGGAYPLQTDTSGYLKLSSGTGTGQVSITSGAVAVTSNIKKNQALASFMFLMTDSTNHAPATGLTVSVTRSIDAGAFGAGTLGSVSEIGSGIYSVNFGAGDLNGNDIILKATATGADTRFERIVTQP